MRHLVKNPEPSDFTSWKTNDKMLLRGRPNWKRLSNAPGVKQNLKRALLGEQGGPCCYCERHTTLNESHIEHFKPREKFKTLMFDYNNLLCSCQNDLEVKEPRICGNAKGSYYDANLLISPLDTTCEKRFAYAFDGSIRPKNNDAAAKTTIRKLNLDADKLRSWRKGVIDGFLHILSGGNSITASVDNWLSPNQDGTFNEFYTTIKYLFT